MNEQEAKQAVTDPMTPAAVLADIAYRFPDLRVAAVGHPAAYPGLIDWLDSTGDPLVSAAVSARRAAETIGEGPVLRLPSISKDMVDTTVLSSDFDPAPQQVSPAVPVPVAPAVTSPAGVPTPESVAVSGSPAMPIDWQPPVSPLVSSSGTEPGISLVGEPTPTPGWSGSAPTPLAQPSSYQVGGVVDAPSFGYAVLGFFIPVAGLILFLVWKNQMPLRAKSAGKGALVSVILYVLFYVVLFAVIGAMGSY